MIRAGIAIWVVMLCMLTANAQNVVTLAGQSGISGAANGSVLLQRSTIHMAWFAISPETYLLPTETITLSEKLHRQVW